MLDNEKPAYDKAPLYGRVFITGQIKIVTGLHVGASRSELAIGAVDGPVVRDPLTNRPYIPGSSLRGKMRSLWEKRSNVVQNGVIRAQDPKVAIHRCENANDYAKCPVCRIYGVPGDIFGDRKLLSPTRLVIRDLLLDESEAARLDAARTQLPYTEVKWEATIDRVTSAAVPRQIERVPADTVLRGLEMIYSLYKPGDEDLVIDILKAMQLLEDDYLGGQGSRGSGKIRFEGLSIVCRNSEAYETIHEWSEYLRSPARNKWPENGIQSVQQVLDLKDDLVAWLKEMIPIPAPQPTP